jgi:DNA-binding CsgD family transcriptional regulator
MAAGQHATADDRDLAALGWPLIELIEAAARCGRTETATRVYRQFGEMATATGTDWALGAQARSGALLSEDADAEHLSREAIVRLGRTRLRVDLARAHLVYGEWLRRERRRSEARDQLRTAHGTLEAMGVAAFAARARRELQSTGAATIKRTDDAVSMPSAGVTPELTAQETQVARLARDGLSNPEIGTRLFISARTVQYHLSKAFTKLGISSRSQLHRVLPSDVASASLH